MDTITPADLADILGISTRSISQDLVADIDREVRAALIELNGGP